MELLGILSYERNQYKLITEDLVMLYKNSNNTINGCEQLHFLNCYTTW